MLRGSLRRFVESGGRRKFHLTVSAPKESDDSSIDGDWRLLRRIPLVWLVRDENKGGWTITSQAFQGHPTDRLAFSVQLEPVLLEHGLTHDFAVKDREAFGLAAFTAQQARSLQQIIKRDPILPDDPAHAKVIGEKTNSIKKKFRDFAVWVIPPKVPA